MPSHVLSVKELAQSITTESKRQAAAMVARKAPLAVAAVLIGESPAEARILGENGQACNDAGIDYRVFTFPADAAAAAVDARVTELAQNSEITGITVTTAVDAEIDSVRARREVPVAKDVMGLHPATLGRMLVDGDMAEGANPRIAAVLAALTSHDIDIYDKLVLLYGPPQEVGLPLTTALVRRHAQVVVASSAGELSPAVWQAAEVVIATGPRGVIAADRIKAGATLIDIGSPGPGESARSFTGGGVFAAETSAVAAAILPAGGLATLEQALMLQNIITCAREAENRPLEAVITGEKNSKGASPRNSGQIGGEDGNNRKRWN